MNKFHILIAAVLSAGVTFGLFLFMQKLISSGAEDRAQLDAIAGIHFGPVEIPDEIAIRNRRIAKKPPPPKDPPPAPRMQISKVDQPVQDMPQMDLPQLDVPMVGGQGMFIGNFRQVDTSAEGDVVPVMVIRPMYPREAAIEGIEGWVKLEFTITASGSVQDARVIEANPARIFNREAIRAILKWKFKPRVVDGVAVDRRATQVIDFSLHDGED